MKGHLKANMSSATSFECAKLLVFPSGEFWGAPEEAFEVSAGVYLGR